MTIVRIWRPADRPAILALTIELRERERALRASRRYGTEMTDAYVAALETAFADEDEDGSLFVAEANGRVVGFATCFVGEDILESDPREVTVQDLIVTAAARGQGAGRRLLAAVRRFAAERGIRRVVVSALAANTAAAAVYRTLGFRPVSLVLEVDATAAALP